MYCKNCGNQLNESMLYCPNCGNKKESKNAQSNTSQENTKRNIFLSNQVVFVMFIINMILLCIEITKSLIGVNSGFMLFFIPIICLTISIPLIIGLILSGINLKMKNYKILIGIFISSLFSIILILSLHSKLFSLLNIVTISLSIIVFLKLILKIYK